MARVNPNAIYHPRSRKARHLNTREKRKSVINHKQKLHKSKQKPQHKMYLFLKSKLVNHPEYDTVPEDVVLEWILEFADMRLKELLGDKKEAQLSTTDQLKYHGFKQMREDISGKGYSFVDLDKKDNTVKIRLWDGKSVDMFASCTKRVYKTSETKEREANVAAESQADGMEVSDKKKTSKKAAKQQDAMQDE